MYSWGKDWESATVESIINWVIIINWDVSFLKKEIRNSEIGHDIITIFWALGLNLVRFVTLDTNWAVNPLK